MSPLQGEDLFAYGSRGVASLAPGYFMSRLQREDDCPTAHCPLLTAHRSLLTAHCSLPQQDADALAIRIAGDHVEFAVAVCVGNCQAPNSSAGHKR